MEEGEWGMDDGEWRMANGEWRRGNGNGERGRGKGDGRTEKPCQSFAAGLPASPNSTNPSNTDTRAAIRIANLARFCVSR